MEFQTDYLIAWDFNDKDFPCVTVSRMSAGRNVTNLVVDMLDQFHTRSGICSLQQLLSEFNSKEGRP